MRVPVSSPAMNFILKYLPKTTQKYKTRTTYHKAWGYLDSDVEMLSIYIHVLKVTYFLNEILGIIEIWLSGGHVCLSTVDVFHDLLLVLLQLLVLFRPLGLAVS